MKRGEIWLVRLDPGVGHEIRKTRPALIVENDAGSDIAATRIVAPITSKRTDRLFSVDLYLTPENSGLPLPSKVLCEQLRCTDRRRFVRKLGEMHPKLIPELNNALRIALAL